MLLDFLLHSFHSAVVNSKFSFSLLCVVCTATYSLLFHYFIVLGLWLFFSFFFSLICSTNLLSDIKSGLIYWVWLIDASLYECDANQFLLVNSYLWLRLKAVESVVWRWGRRVVVHVRLVELTLICGRQVVHVRAQSSMPAVVVVVISSG